MRLPPDQVRCVRELLKIAGQEGRTVTVVDVNEPTANKDLIAGWVGPTDVFPLLVRPDGARLAGDENFRPQKLRRFVRGR
jgi:hypothetical protein